MAGETPVRVDQEAHTRLKEEADESGRTLRDLASEAIKTHTGRDLLEEVSGEVSRLREVGDRLEKQVDALEGLAGVSEEIRDLIDRLEEVEENLASEGEAIAGQTETLRTLVNGFEDALVRSIEMLRDMD